MSTLVHCKNISWAERNNQLDCLRWNLTYNWIQNKLSFVGLSRLHFSPHCSWFILLPHGLTIFLQLCTYYFCLSISASSHFKSGTSLIAMLVLAWQQPCKCTNPLEEISEYLATRLKNILSPTQTRTDLLLLLPFAWSLLEICQLAFKTKKQSPQALSPLFKYYHVLFCFLVKNDLQFKEISHLSINTRNVKTMLGLFLHINEDFNLTLFELMPFLSCPHVHCKMFSFFLPFKKQLKKKLL